MLRTHLLPLAALAALGVCVNPAARAQSLTLNDGDAVVVDGTGTQGTIGGTPVSNATTSYTNTYGEQGAVLVKGTATFTLGPGGTLTAGGGYYTAGLLVAGSGTVSVTGGTVTTAGTSQFALYDYGSSIVNISGGTFAPGPGSFGAIYTNHAGGAINVTGGTFTAVQGGTGLVNVSSTINLFSFGDTPFLVNGIPMNNTTLADGSSGTIRGTLLDGETLSTTFYNSGTFNLNVGLAPAPEPSQYAALAVGVFGLGLLTLRARRRSAA